MSLWLRPPLGGIEPLSMRPWPDSAKLFDTLWQLLQLLVKNDFMVLFQVSVQLLPVVEPVVVPLVLVVPPVVVLEVPPVLVLPPPQVQYLWVPLPEQVPPLQSELLVQ